jgi:hypothetical protein
VVDIELDEGEVVRLHLVAKSTIASI